MYEGMVLGSLFFKSLGSLDSVYGYDLKGIVGLLATFVPTFFCRASKSYRITYKHFQVKVTDEIMNNRSGRLIFSKQPLNKLHMPPRGLYHIYTPRTIFSYLWKTNDSAICLASFYIPLCIRNLLNVYAFSNIGLQHTTLD